MSESPEYTPTWDEIATGFGEYALQICESPAEVEAYGHDYRDGSGYRAASRWLAEHDREVAEAAWDAGRNTPEVIVNPGRDDCAHDWHLASGGFGDDGRACTKCLLGWGSFPVNPYREVPGV